MDEDSFYRLLTHIEVIGIYDRGFFSTVDNYKELVGIEVEDDYSYIADESYEEKESYEKNIM